MSFKLRKSGLQEQIERFQLGAMRARFDLTEIEVIL